MCIRDSYNDDPVSPSLKNYLKAVGDKKELSEEYPYYNLMYKMFKQGVASLGYRDAPNLFDQIIVSKNALSDSLQKNYTVFKAEVYAPTYLISTEGPVSYTHLDVYKRQIHAVAQ